MSKVVLITGGSAGIGRTTATAFAQLGYRLAIAARSPDRLQDTAIALEKETNADVLAVPTDVTVPAEVEALVQATLDRYGEIDILVNNAGICASGPFQDTTLEQWQQVLDVNLWGCVHAIRAALPHMLARKQGQIVNVSSFGGKMPLPDMVAYCTSKYAVTGLTDALRLELQPHGIQVIGIYPGIVKSDFLERAIFTDEGGAGTPTQRQQVEAALKSFVSQSPNAVADAVVDACRSGKTEVVVGPLQLATAAYQFFPGLVGPLLGGARRA
jgi:short-subunit dehydrogenase